MNRRNAFAPIVAVALAATALTTAAMPASARPMTSCNTLKERMVADYDKYEQDKHEYGTNDPRTEKAYDNYVKAKYAYEKCL